MAESRESFVIRVNGTDRSVRAPRARSLLHVLREDLSLTGAKYGCGEGECGACTVLLDGRPIRSCQVPIAAVQNRSILTIEGLAPPNGLHPVQQAFLEVQAFQCGYCTPAIILRTVALLKANYHPTELDIREALAGHLCRCGTYPRIIRAVQLAAQKMRG